MTATDALGAVIYNFNDTGARGTPPCRLQLQNSGAFAIIDSLNVVWQVNLQIVPAVGASGVISAGQNLAQVMQEPTSSIFLVHGQYACLACILSMPSQQRARGC